MHNSIQSLSHVKFNNCVLQSNSQYEREGGRGRGLGENRDRSEISTHSSNILWGFRSISHDGGLCHPRMFTFLGCDWRRWPLDMKGNREYIL